MSDKENKVLPEDLVDELLMASAPIDPGKDAAARMKSRILDRVGEPSEMANADLLTVRDDSGDWIETGPGNSIKILRSDEESMSILVRLEAGATFPKHYHPEDEDTYVVEGETWFGDIHLQQGDFHHAPKGTMHGEVTTETGCVLLIRKAAE